MLVELGQVPALARSIVEEAVRVGAMCPQRDLERHAEALAACPLLALALPYVGHVATRNRGTVGGSIAHADAAAELPLVLQTLAGEVEVTGRGRAARARGGVLRLAPDELPRAGRARHRGALPGRRRGLGRGLRRGRSAPRRLRRVRPGCALRVEDGVVTQARLGAGAVADRPVRLPAAEAILVGTRCEPEALAAAAEEARAGVDPSDGMHASAEYRRHLTGVLAGRSAQRAYAMRRRREGARAHRQRPARARARRGPPAALRLPAPLLGLRGTHVGCEHGVCGACTVRLDGRAVRSCLLLAAQAEGCSVETVEALAEPDGPLSALQDAFRRHHALQCGFCTPGILMSAAELLADDGDADAARDRGAALGPPLPLHGLRADRGRHRRGRGDGRVNLGEHLLACASAARRRSRSSTASAARPTPSCSTTARSTAGGLAERGVRPGDRVAVALKNRLETVVLYWASQWLGAVFVPLNWRLRPDELTYCVSDCGARLLAVEDASAEAGAAVPDMPLIVIGRPSAGGRSIRPTARGAVARRRPRPGADALHLGHDRAPQGRAALAPRGALGGARATRAARAAPRRPHARRDAALPHDGHALPARRERLRGVFCSQPEFRADVALAAIERERLTSLYLAPTLFHDLVAAQRERPRDLSSVRALAYAGAPMTGVLVERCVEAFAPEAFVNHYGSTEIYTFTVHGDQRAKPGCAGRAALNARIRLVEPVPGASPHAEVARGVVGQVACALSSDEAFSGYWQRPDADERQIRDGWYFPGDLGQIDDEGDLYLVGRIDDMIVSGGENVHPLEIEEWLVRHPGVDEAAVVGEPDERLGERVVAFVVGAGR